MDALKQDDVVSQRWLAIAKTDIEKAFMALSRSITEQVKQ
ncbi:Acb2/Tad1 domain-containing protein [Herbiconiux daphne]